jgi:hypothetical protein
MDITEEEMGMGMGMGMEMEMGMGDVGEKFETTDEHE